MAVAALLLLLFGADLAVRLPFGRPSLLVDVLFLLSAAMLGYMSWSTYREQV
jgi:hypothetical protein